MGAAAAALGWSKGASVLVSGIVRKVNSGMGMVTGIDLEKGATVRAP